MSERTDDDGGVSLEPAGGVLGASRDDDAWRTRRDDGQTVGSADLEEDVVASGGDTGGTSGDPAWNNQYEEMTGDIQPSDVDDGEAVGEADRDADIERSR